MATTSVTFNKTNGVVIHPKPDAEQQIGEFSGYTTTATQQAEQRTRLIGDSPAQDTATPIQNRSASVEELHHHSNDTTADVCSEIIQQNSNDKFFKLLDNAFNNFESGITLDDFFKIENIKQYDEIIDFLYNKIHLSEFNYTEDAPKVLAITKLLATKLEDLTPTDNNQLKEYSKFYVILSYFVDSNLDQVTNILESMLAKNNNNNINFLDLKMETLVIKGNRFPKLQIAYLELLVRISKTEQIRNGPSNDNSKAFQLINSSLKHIEEISTSKSNMLRIFTAITMKNIFVNLSGNDITRITNTIFENQDITEEFKLELALVMRSHICLQDIDIDSKIFYVDNNSQTTKKTDNQILNVIDHIKIKLQSDIFNKDVFSLRVAALTQISSGQSLNKESAIIKVLSFYEPSDVLIYLTENKEISRKLIKSGDNTQKKQLIDLLFLNTKKKLTADQAQLAFNLLNLIAPYIYKNNDDTNLHGLFYTMLYSLSRYDNIDIFEILNSKGHSDFNKKIFSSGKHELITEYLTFMEQIAKVEDCKTAGTSKTSDLFIKLLPNITKTLETIQISCLMPVTDISRKKAAWLAYKITNVMQYLPEAQQQEIIVQLSENSKISKRFNKFCHFFIVEKNIPLNSMAFGEFTSASAKLTEYMLAAKHQYTHKIYVTLFTNSSENKKLLEVDSSAEVVEIKKQVDINEGKDILLQIYNVSCGADNTFFENFSVKQYDDLMKFLFKTIHSLRNDKAVSRMIIDITKIIIEKTDHQRDYTQDLNLYGKVYQILSFCAITNAEEVLNLVNNMADTGNNINNRFYFNLIDNKPIHSYISLIANIAKIVTNNNNNTQEHAQKVVANLIEKFKSSIILNLCEETLTDIETEFFIQKLLSALLKTNSSYSADFINTVFKNPYLSTYAKNRLLSFAKDQQIDIPVESILKVDLSHNLEIIQQQLSKIKDDVIT